LRKNHQNFKPAVKTAWEEDLATHKDFEGWQFCQKQDDREFNYVNERKPFVCFASFQDVLGKNAVGGIKATNEWIQTVDWDCIVLDEYHYGAWGRNARNFYDKKDPALMRALEVGDIINEDADNVRELEAREIASQGEFDEFDLNEFFRADDKGFIHEEYVQKWLDLIRGAYTENIVTELKLGTEKPPMPFSDSRLLSYLQHTYWFLPSVAACEAMARLLQKRVNRFYSDYRVIVAAGNRAGMGAAAVGPVYEAMNDPQESKTITLYIRRCLIVPYPLSSPLKLQKFCVKSSIFAV